jgi:hypothetical protein
LTLINDQNYIAPVPRDDTTNRCIASRVLRRSVMSGGSDPTRLSPAALLATTTVVACLLIGCGSSSPSSHSAKTAGHATATTSTKPEHPSSTASLTKSQLIAAADAICGRVNQMIFSNPYRSQADIPRLAPQIAALEQSSVEEMAKLVPPASLAHDWQQILADSRRRARDTAKLGELAGKGGMKQVGLLLSRDAPIETRLLSTAQRDGFQVCSKPA